jgi:ligand-binding sensor domain-containing protein
VKHNIARICAVALTVVGIGAKQPASELGRYEFNVWRAQDGVRLSFASNLVQTRDGYLWLSSQSGLTRFDGLRFKVFDTTNTPSLHGRPRLQTYPLLADPTDALWIGTDVGLLTLANGVLKPEAVDASFNTDLVNAATVDSRGTVWAVTRSGRVLRIPRHDTFHVVSGTVVSYAGSGIAVDRSGDVWIAAGHDAVYRAHGDALEVVTFPPELRASDPTRVFAAADGSVWFGTPSALVRWRAGQFTSIPLPPRQSLAGVSCIAEAPDGALWIGTHGAGLYRFDGQRFASFTSRDGLSDDRVIDILVDRSGNVWVATRDGLNRFRPVAFDVFTSQTGLPTDLPGGMIQDAAGVFWLAPPTGGLFRGRIEHDEARFTAAEPARNDDRIAAIARARSGGVWTGRFLGSVSRFADGGPLAEPIARGLPPVTDLLEDADGTLWVGTWRGLYRIRGTQRRSFAARDGLPDDVVERVYRDSGGTLWVATQTGIARAARPGEERFTIQPMPDGSAERAVVLFEAPVGTLWLGSADGLARVTGGRPAFLGVAQGLPENWVGAAERDGVGGLWLGQLAGLTRVNLADLTAVADGREPALRSATTYEALDGLPGGDPAAWPHPYSLRDASGRIWFAMGHGIAVVDPGKVGGNASAPLIQFDEVAIDGVVAPAGTTVTVAPTARRLELRYTGVDLTNGPRLRFRYRLDGFDPDWFEAGTQRAAAYTHLPPGRYRFRVTGRAPNGAWNPTEAAMGVVVLAPIYQRTWFLVIGSLALGLTAWTAHLVLLRTRGEAVRAERSRLAREIHDSLLQGFGGIALQLHAASEELALPPQQQSRLDRVLSLIDRTLTQGRQVVWDIRLPGLAAADLAVECEAAARHILAGTATVARVAVRGRRRQLPAARQAEILRIVEEALANVRNHAQARSVLLELDYGWRQLGVAIRDDGHGFDAKRQWGQVGHWGLLGMRERASRIGAWLVVESRPGSGTVVRVEAPYAEGFLALLRSLLPRGPKD